VIEKDNKLEEIIVVFMRIKEEDELHVLISKVCFNLFK
jgi:hypothetical protein